MSGSFTASKPLTAYGFLSTLGVDTHIAYTDGGYANITNVIADLKYLGITQVRDGISNGADGSAPLSSYIAIAEAGIRFTFIIDVSSTASLTATLNLINQVAAAVPGSVTAVEGPNEINNQPVTYNNVSGLQGALNEQADIYTAVHSDPALSGVPVDYFTGYGAGGLAVGPDPSMTPGLADYDNQHPYPNNAQAPEAYVARAVALENETSSTAPAVYTETGYTTDQVNAEVQAKYELDLVMDTAAEGISKTYLYELMDAYAPGSAQGDAGFGLFDYTTAPKEAATALHVLTTLLQDGGANAASFVPTAFSYSITGLPSTGHSLAVEESDGSKIISVWNEPQIWNSATQTEISVAASAVTVGLGASYASVSVYDPLVGTNPIATYSNVSSVAIAVTDHPLLVKFSTTVITAPTTGADTLVLNVSEIAKSGKDAQFTVSVDGTQIGGVETVTAAEVAGASQDITLTGNFGSGPHKVAISYLDGFTGNQADYGRTLYLNAITFDNATQFADGEFAYDTTATYTVQAPTPAVASNVGAVDTLVLSLSETAMNGQNAEFLVSVDGQITGDVQTVTASHAAGASQTITLTGDFGSGSHVVTIDFVNGFAGNPLDQGRMLYVNAITLDGLTTTENASQAYVGSQSYQVTAGSQTTPVTPPPTGTTLPSVSISSQALTSDTGASATDDITSNGAVTLVGTVSGASGTTVVVYNATTALGAATVSNGTWRFTTTLPQGSYALTAVATDPSGNTAKSLAEPTIIVQTAAPVVAITTPAETLTAATTTAVVTVSGTLSGLAGSSVEVLDGTTPLGAATVTGGTWSYAATLAIGNHSLTAVATDLAGNGAVSAADLIGVVAPTAPPPTTGADTLVLNVSEIAKSGKDAQFTVSVDGTQIGGVETVTAAEVAGASQDITLTGNFGSGPHKVAISYLDGFTGNQADYGRTLYLNAITFDNATQFADGEFAYDTTATYTVQAPTPAVASNVGAVDTLVLSLSETAMNGQNAEFLVSVDGQITGDVQTVTASHAAGASQTITLTGDFGSGSHVVTIDFVNGFAGNPLDQGRMLYVNAITLDGLTTTENASQAYVGSQSYQVTAGSQTQATSAVVTATPAASSGPQTFTYSAGQGALEIAEPNAANGTLVLGAGLSAADVVVAAGTNGALVITDGIAGDIVTIDGMLGATGSGIAQMKFIGGTVWTASQLRFTATTATPSADTIYGTSGNDVIDGRGGADTVYGGGGSDVYVFRQGYGALQIDNGGVGGSSAGQLDFGTSLTANNLWFSQVGTALDVTALDGHDQVVIQGWFGANGSARLSEFVSGDGKMLDGGLGQLMTAMTTYQAANPGFNPATATAMPVNSALQAAIAAAWHS
jgi:hypothetical protein